MPYLATVFAAQQPVKRPHRKIKPDHFISSTKFALKHRYSVTIKSVDNKCTKLGLHISLYVIYRLKILQFATVLRCKILRSNREPDVLPCVEELLYFRAGVVNFGGVEEFDG